MSENPEVQMDLPQAVSRRAHRHRTKRRSNAVLIFLRDVAVIIVSAVVISFLIKTFLIRSFYIPSESMEGTLLVNDRIIVNELVPQLVPVSRGDVVVFRDPGGWLRPAPTVEKNLFENVVEWLGSLIGLTAPDSDIHLIKRVIGISGDTVACCNDFGRITVNGVPINETPYVKLPPGFPRVSRDDFSVTVPDNALWVMGDNRNNSLDSRYNRDKPGEGFVPMSNVVGRAFVISWPINRWSWLDNYPLVFADI